MTIKEKKAYLYSYQDAEQSIRDIEAEIEQLRSGKMSPSVSLDGQPKAATNADLSSYAARLDELERKLDEKYKIAVELRVKIEMDITQMIDEDERNALRYYYLEGMTWYEVGKKMNFSIRHIQRIGRSAIENFRSD